MHNQRSATLLLLVVFLSLLLCVFHIFNLRSSVIVIPGTASSRRQTLSDPQHGEPEKCLSKTQRHFYDRSNKEYRPSAYFKSRLHKYEQLHHRCAREAENFSSVLASRSSKRNSSSSESGCQFVVWISYHGMGNKILSLVSAFLYALLTNRVLLLDRGADITELFCEPFPGTSWFLPLNFPHDYLHSLDVSSPNRFGLLVKPACSRAGWWHPITTSFPGVVYVHVIDTWTPKDEWFFCEREQELLQQANVTWLLLRSDIYFTPFLYFMPSFRKELRKLFPDQETVFRYTARNILHPSNSVWSMTKRFADTYLADADVLVGLQLRSFDTSEKTLNEYWQQASDCVTRRGLLPKVEAVGKPDMTDRAVNKSVHALVTSLHGLYYHRLKDLYIKYPTFDKSVVVKVHTPSHEGLQQTDDVEHDRKALMEIYLLAMCDVLVVSPRSTFGYVAHGLSGVRPWALHGQSSFQRVSVNTKGGCYMMASSEPCFVRRPYYECGCDGESSPPAGLRPCQDFLDGLKL